ncbi:MAG: COQ9 family protein [Phenylobacterium sp.]|uniref:COQ9 family protein n=1 Tax=Phenylobacterium sp. TaxID=1871053 RepID=UPI00391AA584
MTDADAWAAEAEDRVLDKALELAPTMGWTRLTARAAGRACGLTPADVELLMPNGAADLAALLARRHDARALAALGDVDPQALKVRERVRAALAARIEAAAADGPAVRRWAGWLALPHHLPLAARLLWASADALWRWAGDTATDENHYSKRAILGGVLAGALAIRLQQGEAAAMAFVDARIDNVMTFEKWKATTRLRPQDALRDLAVALGKLRYG